MVIFLRLSSVFDPQCWFSFGFVVCVEFYEEVVLLCVFVSTWWFCLGRYVFSDGFPVFFFRFPPTMFVFSSNNYTFGVEDGGIVAAPNPAPLCQEPAMCVSGVCTLLTQLVTYSVDAVRGKNKPSGCMDKLSCRHATTVFNKSH